jgi:hypothetical protein
MENHPLHDQFIAYAEERSLLRDLVAQYELLLDAVESADLAQAEIAEGELDEFLSRFPGIPNYDSKGNWIGSVSNENGWTA